MARRRRKRKIAAQAASGAGRWRLPRRTRPALAAGAVAALVVVAVTWSALGEGRRNSGDSAADSTAAASAAAPSLFGGTPVATPSAAERSELAAKGQGLIRAAAERAAAPPMRLQTASYGDGSVFDLSQERGNVVVVYFMAAWCFTCIPETQALAQIDANYADAGVRVLILDVDQTEDEDDLAEFRESYGNGQHLWAMDRDFGVAQALGVQILDATVIIDRDGRIAYRDGVPTSYETLAAVIEALP